MVERQHAAAFSALLPLFLLGRLRLDDGDLISITLGRDRRTGVLVHEWAVLASTLRIEQAWDLRSILLVLAFTAFP